MSKFVFELPEDPEEGSSYYLAQGKEGFWLHYTRTNGRWIWTGGMAIPYVPLFMADVQHLKDMKNEDRIKERS